MLEPELLKKARAAAVELAEIERSALLCKAEYHTAVRRLHLGGASLREIADALALSHQRVQQIVQQAGGTWWRSMWSTRRPKRDAVCSFCARPPSEVAKLIAGPDIYICDACVALAERPGEGRAPGFTLAEPSARIRCSFCARRNASGRRLSVGRGGRVCGDCLRTCREILDSQPS